MSPYTFIRRVAQMQPEDTEAIRCMALQIVDDIAQKNADRYLRDRSKIRSKRIDQGIIKNTKQRKAKPMDTFTLYWKEQSGKRWQRVVIMHSREALLNLSESYRAQIAQDNRIEIHEVKLKIDDQILESK